VYRLFLIFTVVCFYSSCKKASHLKKADLCERPFVAAIAVPQLSGEANYAKTVYHGNGTFSSGEFSNIECTDTISSAQFTGTWLILDTIPDIVKKAVERYDASVTDYSIVKYTSKSGKSGYCLYYNTSGDFWIGPIQVGKMSDRWSDHLPGASEIFAGYSNGPR
jgi:hypothetical protein